MGFSKWWNVWICASSLLDLPSFLLPAISKSFLSIMMKSENSSVDSFFHPVVLPLPAGEYEVFLSFRGPDVRHTFADCLYSCLVRAKIRTFRDEEELPASLTCINLYLCENMQRLPNLTNLNKLTRLNMDDIGIREIPGLGELKVLETLLISSAPNLENLDGLENLLLLVDMNLIRCCILEKLPTLANLTKLQKLSISQCGLLTEIHGLAGPLGESLSHLELYECFSLGDIGFGALHSTVKFESLTLRKVQLRKLLPPSLSMLTKLRSLTIEDTDCESHILLEAFPDISNLTDLRVMGIASCKELIEVTGLDRLESLEVLNISECSSLRKLSDLSGLTKLKNLTLRECWQLTEVRGFDRLESLEELWMYGCESVKELPNLSGMKNFRRLNFREYTQ